MEQSDWGAHIPALIPRKASSVPRPFLIQRRGGARDYVHMYMYGIIMYNSGTIMELIDDTFIMTVHLIAQK